jgi:hypothetical protein
MEQTDGARRGGHSIRHGVERPDLGGAIRSRALYYLPRQAGRDAQVNTCLGLILLLALAFVAAWYIDETFRRLLEEF